MVSLLELRKSGGFEYCNFFGVGEEWWLRIWYLYWSWGRVVASYMVSLLEMGKSGGFVYGILIGVWGIVVALYMVSFLELGNSGGFVYGFFIGVGE